MFYIFSSELKCSILFRVNLNVIYVLFYDRSLRSHSLKENHSLGLVEQEVPGKDLVLFPTQSEDETILVTLISSRYDNVRCNFPRRRFVAVVCTEVM